MLTCHSNKPYNSSKFVFDICHRNRPYYCQNFVLTYATEADHEVSRSTWGHMPQKHTKTVPEVYADIPQKETNLFQKCMLTYHRKRPTCSRNVCWHITERDQPVSEVYVDIHHRNRAWEPQNFSVGPSCQCCCHCTSTYLVNVISFTNLHDILLHFIPTTSAASYQKVNCFINTYVNSHIHNIRNRSSTCCTLNPDDF
jgi:hypothetical protein